MICIHISDGVNTAGGEIPTTHGPALRSAINEIRNELGERLAGAHSYDKEDALTRAAAVIGALASYINAVILEEDKDYE